MKITFFSQNAGKGGEKEVQAERKSSDKRKGGGMQLAISSLIFAVFVFAGLLITGRLFYGKENFYKKGRKNF
ncbi:MAG: hypothetical protein NC832_01845, partial [Candidatus Omnitrophica bacterium]|nr:hypothetical protein [Candidatus Omnitrophota bacterium]